MPPLIVLGLHRSGTSLVARLLDELGLFMGADLQDDHESRFFIALNEAVFRAADASWDQPAAVAELLRDEARAAELAGRLRAHLSGPGFAAYLGRTRDRRALVRQPWGWKDPRNSFTLPVWLRLFPRARVLHVKRNGIDVAASLETRHRKVVQHYTGVHGAPPPPGRFHLGGVPFTHRPSTLEGGFGLWQEYLSEIGRHLQTRSQALLELRYEDLLQEPQPVISRLAAFCGITPDTSALGRARAIVTGGQPYRFTRSERLRRFAAQLSGDRLFGYAPDIAAALETASERDGSDRDPHEL